MTTATTKGAIDPYADPGTASRTAVKALIMLLITFIMGTLCLQGFNLVFVQIGADVGAADQASLITAIPSIVLGIVSFIYGSLSDFVSLRRMVVFGVLTLFVGSVFGFVASYSSTVACGSSSSPACCRRSAARWPARCTSSWPPSTSPRTSR